MVEILINEVAHSAPSEWSDISLSDAQRVFECGLPAELKKLYDSFFAPTEKIKDGEEIKPVQLTQKFYKNTFPKWIKSVLFALTDITDKELKRVSQDDRIRIYNDCFEWIVIGVRYDGVGYKYTPSEDQDENAEHPVSIILPDENGKECEFFYPPSIQIMDKVRPLYLEPFITWHEIDDLMGAAVDIDAGNLKAASLCAAILLRKKDEEYNEAISLRRSLVWETKLDMQSIWAVFFCTQKQLTLFSQTTLLKEKQVQALSRKGQCGFLV
tara:strand:+ start:3395 stop:4201 length:807 start_codon:yes stop_codon:yes gene_type:complete